MRHRRLASCCRSILRVVVARADPAHAPADPEPAADLRERRRGVLRSAVRVEHHTGHVSAPGGHRHLQRVDDQLRPHVRSHRPAEYPARAPRRPARRHGPGTEGHRRPGRTGRRGLAGHDVHTSRQRRPRTRRRRKRTAARGAGLRVHRADDVRGHRGRRGASRLRLHALSRLRTFRAPAARPERLRAAAWGRVI